MHIWHVVLYFLDGKASLWEGGHRVPAFVFWPGKVRPLRVSDEIVSSADIFPTFASLAGIPVPKDRIIDGT